MFNKIQRIVSIHTRLRKIRFLLLGFCGNFENRLFYTISKGKSVQLRKTSASNRRSFNVVNMYPYSAVRIEIVLASSSTIPYIENI